MLKEYLTDFFDSTLLLFNENNLQYYLFINREQFE